MILHTYFSIITETESPESYKLWVFFKLTSALLWPHLESTFFYHRQPKTKHYVLSRRNASDISDSYLKTPGYHVASLKSFTWEERTIGKIV